MDQLIGHTPLLALPNPHVRLFAKAEWYHLTGSVKDRAAQAMLDAAALPPGGTVIEATSGNMGIALAALSAQRGLCCVIVMPEDMSRERRLLMRAYGAQVILTPAADGMAGAIRKTRELASTTPDSYYVNQFINPNNLLAHYHATGPEIWADTGGDIQIFVAGIGTGATVTGTGRYLKERSPALQVVGVLPESGSIPGIGAGFAPPLLDSDLLSEIITVSPADARRRVRQLAREWGLLTGPSSGAALLAAEILASRPENRGKTLVTLLPDSGLRYLSDGLFP